jgi:hypothetical protein
MCDYSLEHYQSRPARRGERYESTRFSSGSVGFIEAGKPGIAVCMACDTSLRLDNLPQALQTRLHVGASTMATFTRLESGLYHDGLRFENGAAVSLQELGPGVSAVLVDALLPEHEPFPHGDLVLDRIG